MDINKDIKYWIKIWLIWVWEYIIKEIKDRDQDQGKEKDNDNDKLIWKIKRIIDMTITMMIVWIDL